MPPFSRETLNLTAAISTLASAAATAVLLRTVADDLIPDCLRSFLSGKLRAVSKVLSSETTVVIEEFVGIAPNEVFEAAEVYLGSKLPPSTARIRASKDAKEKGIVLGVDREEEIVEWFEGVKVSWMMMMFGSATMAGEMRKKKKESRLVKEEIRVFELRFHKKYRDLVLQRYLGYVLTEAKKIKESRKEIKLHTVDYNGTDYWSSIILDHPATFNTIAMDPHIKTGLIDDLDLFTSRREYYRRVGKAWKRGYLLYGPPGTGKSSLVAAMANYLRFDVYDLDLKEVMCNSDLRRLLIGTASKSILVIEDIDCSVELQNRADDQGGGPTVDDEKISLSGLLNFIDGLWSTCGDERIIVFTTNHKDRLDPALLRPGRMDVHIHMSYCTFNGFKLLASNYLEIQDHPLYKDLEVLFDRVQVTPAEVAGELMKSNDPEIALRGLVGFFLQVLISSPKIHPTTAVAQNVVALVTGTATEIGVCPRIAKKEAEAVRLRIRGREYCHVKTSLR